MTPASRAHSPSAVGRSLLRVSESVDTAVELSVQMCVPCPTDGSALHAEMSLVHCRLIDTTDDKNQSEPLSFECPLFSACVVPHERTYVVMLPPPVYAAPGTSRWRKKPVANSHTPVHSSSSSFDRPSPCSRHGEVVRESVAKFKSVPERWHRVASARRDSRQTITLWPASCVWPTCERRQWSAVQGVPIVDTTVGGADATALHRATLCTIAKCPARTAKKPIQ
jgi:hypothetical protein